MLGSQQYTQKDGKGKANVFPMPSSMISRVRTQPLVGVISFNLIPGGSTLIFEIELLGSNRISDLRFGHDTYIGPLTVLMGINGADLDPEDPYEVKNIYQNWETCKASNWYSIVARRAVMKF